MRKFLLLLCLFFASPAGAQEEEPDPFVDSLVNLTKSPIPEKEKIDAYNDLADYFSSWDSAQTALYTQKSIKLAKETGYAEGLANAYYQIGWVTMMSGDYPTAIYLFETQRQEAKKGGFKQGEANAYNGLGICYDDQGNYDKAREHYQKSFELYESDQDRRGMAKSLSNIGNVYDSQGNYPKALEFYLRSLKIAEEIGYLRGEAICLNNIGLIYHNQELYPKALEYYFKSLDIKKALGDRSRIASTLINLGMVYEEQGRRPMALRYFSNALKIYEELEEWASIAYPLVHIGSIYTKVNEYDSAAKYLERALTVSRQLNHKETICLSHKHLGELHFDQKDYKGAVKQLETSWMLAREIGHIENVGNSLDVLHKAYVKLGQPQKAYDALLRFKQVSDSLQSEERNKKVTQQSMEYRFDREKREMEIEQEKERLLNEQRLEEQKFLTYGFTVGFILLLAIVGVVWKNYKDKQKANAMLEKRNGEIEYQNEKLESKNKEIEQEKKRVEKAYQNIELLSEIGKEITHHISVEEIIETVYSEVNRLMPADGFGIGVYNPAEERIEYLNYIEKGQKLPFHFNYLHTNDNLTCYCFNNRAEIIIQDYPKEFKRYLPEKENIESKVGESPYSIMYLPLVVKNKVLGCVTVQSFERGSYQDRHLNMFRNLAIYTAIALDNAKLFDKTESLLLNILPKQTAEELKETGKASSQQYEQASVLFTDFKGFTMIAEKMSSEQLVSNLDYCFKAFDKIVKKHGLEKIKTIGDAYMAVGGVPSPDLHNAQKAVAAALDMVDFIQKWKTEKEAAGEKAWEVRIGIHTGPLIAGVVGEDKFAYDVWGDTVNMASRMESSGAPGKVNVSESSYRILRAQEKNGEIGATGPLKFEYRGKIKAKNKGEVGMYFVSCST